ncbi:hypothetical protein CQW23_31298 [Capsicum baccatum]|uniref:Uncharacterized protein n=1 Tax=Capsicum baccatum TaxID=33114 RepID=A0A2G2V7X8_CAPBA|nr:hypothetical protein CQW23_31298 [Capsicum baccatum]
MSMTGYGWNSFLQIFKGCRERTGHHATCGALPAAGPYLRLSRFQGGQDRLTHVQVPFKWNLSPLRPSKFSFEYLLLLPRSAPTSAPPGLAPKVLQQPPRLPTHRGLALAHGAWCHGAAVPWCRRALLPWCHGAMVPWCLGAMAPWFQASLVPCCHGACVTRCHGATVPVCHGAMVPRCLCTKLPWCHGACVTRCPGAMAPRRLGSLAPISHQARLVFSLKCLHWKQHTTSITLYWSRYSECIDRVFGLTVKCNLGLHAINFLCCIPNSQALLTSIHCLSPLVFRAKGELKSLSHVPCFLDSSCDVVVHEQRWKLSNTVYAVGMGLHWLLSSLCDAPCE